METIVKLEARKWKFIQPQVSTYATLFDLKFLLKIKGNLFYSSSNGPWGIWVSCRQQIQHRQKKISYWISWLKQHQRTLWLLFFCTKKNPFVPSSFIRFADSLREFSQGGERRALCISNSFCQLTTNMTIKCDYFYRNIFYQRYKVVARVLTDVCFIFIMCIIHHMILTLI